MPSPICEVKEGAGAYSATTDGVDVTPGSTVTIHLVSSAGVSTWSIRCITTDELSDASAVTSALTIDQVNKTAIFTAPVAGRAYRFQSIVNGGIGPDGTVQSDYSTTFGIYTTTGGRRAHAVDETYESNATFGWIGDLNALIRTGSGATPSGATNAVQLADGTGGFTGVNPGTAGQALLTDGTTWAAGALNLASSAARTGTLPYGNGGTGLSALGTALQVLRTNAGATAIEWGTAASAAGSAAEVQVNDGSGNFSAATNVKAGSGYVSIGGTPASAGTFRLLSTGSITARNAANSADVYLCQTDSSNNLYVGSSSSNTSQASNLYLYSTTSVNVGAGSTAIAIFDTSNGWSNQGYVIQWVNSAATPTLKQATLATNSATGQTLTVQAQNCSGTTSTGGALILTSGTGTSTNGALKLQVGASDVITLDSTTQATLKPTTLIYSGDSKVTVTEVIANVQTTNATVTDLYTFTITDEAVTILDVTLVAVKSDGTAGASYKRSLTYRRDGGSVSLIGSTRDNATDEDSSAWDVTVDNSGSTGRVRVTGAAATTIRWGGVIRTQVVIP